jgi:hypothetical protein
LAVASLIAFRLTIRMKNLRILRSLSQVGKWCFIWLRKNLALLKDNGDPRFTSKTIVNYHLIAAAVFATAKDRKGKQFFPRQWDLNYIGLPTVDKKAQNAPTVEAAEIEFKFGLLAGKRIANDVLAATAMHTISSRGREAEGSLCQFSLPDLTLWLENCYFACRRAWTLLHSVLAFWACGRWF